MPLVNAAGDVQTKSTVTSDLTDVTIPENKLVSYDGPELYQLFPLPNSSTDSRTLALQPGNTYTQAQVDAFFPSASIAAITPATGTDVGHTAVTITGAGFLGASGASVDGVALTSFVVVDDNTITGVTGDMDGTHAGTVDVVVHDDGGDVTKVGAFTMSSTLPTVASISPTTGTSAGGTATVITGTFLTGATGVTFAGGAGTAFSVVNATTIHVTTPAHAAGAVTVIVQHPRGNVTKTTFYTYT